MTATLHVPSRGERWPLLERLGRGGAGETWRALRQSALISDEVCVKLPLCSPDAEERRAILEEARVLSRVRHGNVVSLLDVVEDDQARPVLVLELVRGTDLKRAMKMGLGARLTPAAIAAIGRAVALALAALGRAFVGGAAHRDVSPHNILVSREGEVKLADFGIARAHGSERRTRSGHLKGKCAYLAPERVRGEAGDDKSDVFSLGVVLFELAAGQRPFPGTDFISQLDAILHATKRPIASLAPGLPSKLARAIDASLAREPSDRPAPDAFARELADASAGPGAIDALRELARLVRGPGLARVALRNTGFAGPALSQSCR